MKFQAIFLGFILALLAASSALPAFAATSYTITVQTSSSTYKVGQTAVVSGAVSPVPPPGTEVALKVTGPTGRITYENASTLSSTGTYKFSFVLSPSSVWPAGTYTVNVTWAESYQGPFASNTTTFAIVSVPTPVTPTYTITAFASSPVLPGQDVQVEAVAMWSNGSPLTTASFPMAEVITPSGASVSLGSFKQIANGVYQWSMLVPSSYQTGVYAVILESNVSGSTQYEETSFTVNTQLATVGQVSALNSSVSSLSSEVSSLSSEVSSLSSAVSGISSSLGTLSSTVTSYYNTLNSAVSGISSSLSTLGSTVSSDYSSLNSAVSSMSSQVSSLSTLSSAVSSLTTYLLVVVVLAIIIIVLQIVTLARRR